MIALWLLSIVSPLAAQKPVPIDLAGLESPPEPIAALIRSAQVTMEAGPREVAGNPNRDPGITAETHYQIAYNYEGRSRWRITPDAKQVVIHVRFFSIEWKPAHRIWFLTRPATAGFWSDKLVLHELDHVRISTDQRLRKRFEQMLGQRRVLRRTLGEGEAVNQAMVDRLVDQCAAEVFAEINELIDIRYKELDRVTSHGRMPIPRDSALNDFLSPDGANSDADRSR